MHGQVFSLVENGVLAVVIVKAQLSRVQGRTTHFMADVWSSQQDCWGMPQALGGNSPVTELQSGSALCAGDADHTEQNITALIQSSLWECVGSGKIVPGYMVTDAGTLVVCLGQVIALIWELDWAPPFTLEVAVLQWVRALAERLQVDITHQVPSSLHKTCQFMIIPNILANSHWWTYPLCKLMFTIFRKEKTAANTMKANSFVSYLLLCSRVAQFLTSIASWSCTEITVEKPRGIRFFSCCEQYSSQFHWKEFLLW